MPTTMPLTNRIEYSAMNQEGISKIHASLDHFTQWLEKYGETSFDHQSYFVGPWGGKAKALYYKKPLLGILAVAPMIFSEAFVPSARRFFWKKQRLPIADAHYAMGFAFLSQVLNKTLILHNDKKDNGNNPPSPPFSKWGMGGLFDGKKYYEKAVHFLNVLEETRCPGYKHYCWGYPFDWVTSGGTIAMGTPLITTTPYAYEAFLHVYQIDKKDKWLEIIRSIAEHTMHDYKDYATSPEASACSYTPFDEGGVINASAYRAFLLTSASIQFSEDKYWRVAERNLNFVLQSQQSDGSWYYAADGTTSFIDHFHTCFVLKALSKIEQLTGHEGCHKAIEKGVDNYTRNLFDEEGLPKPFSQAPRFTVYRHELYDYAECINLAVLLRNRYSELDRLLLVVLQDLLSRWQKPDGSFRSRKLLIGWDNVPMHRWAQAQMFRALCFLLYQESAITNNQILSKEI
jgi:hypothetical protein